VSLIRVLSDFEVVVFSLATEEYHMILGFPSSFCREASVSLPSYSCRCQQFWFVVVYRDGKKLTNNSQRL
jgi:hypothetical protein